MRTLKVGSYQRIADIAALWQGWRNCKRGKRRSPAVAAFEIDCDRHLLALQRELLAQRYQASPWRLHGIRDPKLRLIAAPAVRDRVLHHALLNEIGPLFERGFCAQSFAAGTGRGPQRAAFYFLRCQRRYNWRLQLDISAYFLSIPHDRLLALFSQRIRDQDTLRLIQRILQAGDKVYGSRFAKGLLQARCPPAGQGLPLGSWFSQWCGNFYLDGLDQFIKRQLKIPGYLRFMDEMCLFADDKTLLLAAQQAVADWFNSERGLQLNPKHRTIAPTTASAVFVGYRISRSGIAPSRKLRRRLKQRLQLAVAQDDQVLLRTLQAYKGLLLFPW